MHTGSKCAASSKRVRVVGRVLHRDPPREHLARDGGEQHSVNLVADERRSELLEDLLGDLLEIHAIALRQKDALDACAVSGEHLLLDASDR